MILEKVATVYAAFAENPVEKCTKYPRESITGYFLFEGPYSGVRQNGLPFPLQYPLSRGYKSISRSVTYFE